MTMSTTDRSVRVRPLRAEDVAWVQPLYAANSRDALTPEQRAEHGFVQGRMSDQALRARLDGPGSVVAEVDGRPAGVLLTSLAEGAPDGPPVRTVETARAAGVQDFYLYGPALVAESARGRGVLRAMAEHVLTATAAAHRAAVAFVEDENTASMAAHTRLGWEPVGRFEHEGRGFTVLTHATTGTGAPA